MGNWSEDMRIEVLNGIAIVGIMVIGFAIVGIRIWLDKRKTTKH